MYVRTGDRLGWLPRIFLPTLYNRSAAVDYARRYWNIPCNDGIVALSRRDKGYFERVPAGTRFIHEVDLAGNSQKREHALKPDGTRIEWKDLDDCTHYISCCIGQPPGETGGGIPLMKQLGSPPNRPYGIVRVSTMVDYLLGNIGKTPYKYTQAVGTEKTNDSSQISHLDPGDLIAYWHIAKKRYSHLTMYLGNGKIACHTYCRSDDPACTWDNHWELGGATPLHPATHRWTFLHFIV